MTAYSNIAFPKSLQRWKDDQLVYYYNHKDNGIQAEGEEGKRYSADFVILRKGDLASITAALTKAFADPELNQKIIDNIEVDKKPAIDVIKSYKVDATITSSISVIITKTPVKLADTIISK